MSCIGSGCMAFALLVGVGDEDGDGGGGGYRGGDGDLGDEEEGEDGFDVGNYAIVSDGCRCSFGMSITYSVSYIRS